jgi:hypothetical protein
VGLLFFSRDNDHRSFKTMSLLWNQESLYLYSSKIKTEL